MKLNTKQLRKQKNTITISTIESLKDIEPYFIERKTNMQGDYKDRFIKEYSELKDRTLKLERLLDKYLHNELDFKPNCDYNLLYEQFIYMSNYLKVLEIRAEIEGINI